LHVFNFFSQFCPIFGAIIADGYLGNSKTLFLFYIPYALGYGLLTITTIPDELFATKNLVFLALLLICIGNGNIRACITSLGGNQFELPEQREDLDRYFSHYYFLYTLGILLSKVIPPEIRVTTRCWGEGECYTAVYGIIFLIFLGSWISYLIGMCWYKREEPTNRNILLQVVGCIGHAMNNKLKGKADQYPDMLASAVPRYSETFVNDVRSFLRVVTLFIPLPIYWTLFTQQDSSWTFQAARLDTTILGVQLEPDQIKAIGPLMVLTLIPIWQKYLSPYLERRGYDVSPLHSVSLGGFSAAFSFALAGILQVAIDRSRSPPSVLWQLPQFFFLQMGEVLLSIPGLRFAYTQAPQSMKSVLTACWFCNNAFGNLVVVLVTELKPVSKQSYYYFLYSAMMLVAIVIFSFLAHNHRQLMATNVITSDEQVIEKFVYVEELGISNLDLNQCQSTESVVRQRV